MSNFIKALRISLIMLLICGLIYPLTMTGISKLLFPKQSNGSLIESNGKKVGSILIGQNFTDNRYFHGRVSANNYNTYTKEDEKPVNEGEIRYTGVSSGSTNLSPSNPVLVERVKKDMDELLKNNPGISNENVPTDILTSSASGLDPHISPEAARIQIPAVSIATGISETDLKGIVDSCTEVRTFGVFGEPRVNVLLANLEIQKRIEAR